MGWVLGAACSGCGFAQGDLRLGASHAEIGQHDVCHRVLVLASCCGAIQDVLLYMGQPPRAVPCERCQAALDVAAAHRYRISTLKGEVLTAHRCPRCGVDALEFRRTGSFV